jgi:hypothetical protein
VLTRGTGASGVQSQNCLSSLRLDEKLGGVHGPGP